MRISKFWLSTWVCADRIARVTSLDSIGTSSGMLSRFMIALDRRRVEQPHQVVAERQVEARLPGVALPAGAAAQLVVDAPRLVPLGAEHVEAAGLDDLLVLGGDLDRAFVQRVRPGRLVVLGGVERGQAPLAQLGVGEEFGVAAEHDVGASAGHVGRDGDRAFADRPAR